MNDQQLEARANAWRAKHAPEDELAPFCELCGQHHHERPAVVPELVPAPAALENDHAGDADRDGVHSFSDQLNRAAEESGRSSYGANYW